MRIIINGRFLTQRRTGIQRYAFETISALDGLLARSRLVKYAEIILAAPRGTEVPKFEAIQANAIGPFAGHVWEQLTLPAFCRGSLLVNLGPTGPVLKRHQIVTIHDAAVFTVPHTFGRTFGVWYRWIVPLLAERAQYLVTVSEFSKSELTRLLGPKLQSARVSGEGWEHVLRDAPDERILDAHGLRGRPYVLVVGSISPHKNLAVVARAAQLLDIDLNVRVVVAGEVNPAVFGKAGAATSGALTLLGYVTDAELRALYTHAEAFVHPSLYEGFGIPPLEAMALGCPVIASNASAIPEVCGGGAWYFPPDDPAALAGLIRRVVTSTHEREQLIAFGRAQTRRHSWAGSASTFLSLLEQALGIAEGHQLPDERAIGARYRREERGALNRESPTAHAIAVRSSPNVQDW